MMIHKSTSIKITAINLSLSYLYWVTFVMIVISSLFYFVDGYFGGDLEGIDYEVINSKLFLYTSIYLLGLYGALVLSRKLPHLKFTPYKLSSKNKSLLYCFFAAFSLFVLFSAVMGGVGTIHRGVDTNRYAELFFALFDPYIFMVFIIYFVFLNSNDVWALRFFIFYLMAVYLFLIVRSGFTGFLIPVLPIFISMALVFLSKRTVVLMLMASILLFPFIRIGKWMIGAGLDSATSFDINKELIKVAMRGVVERFSAVPNMVYISESLPDKEVFLQSNYLPFFQGYIGSFFHKIIFSEPVALITLDLHKTIQNVDSDSNSTFPIVSYFSLDLFVGFFVFLYALLLVFFISRLLNLAIGGNHAGQRLVSFFLFFVTFYYAFNGWLWAVWGVIQASLLFSLVLFLSGSASKSSVGAKAL